MPEIEETYPSCRGPHLGPDSACWTEVYVMSPEDILAREASPWGKMKKAKKYGTKKAKNYGMKAIYVDEIVLPARELTPPEAEIEAAYDRADADMEEYCPN